MKIILKVLVILILAFARGFVTAILEDIGIKNAKIIMIIAYVIMTYAILC